MDPVDGAWHGLTYEPAQQHTAVRDSLCSITMASRLLLYTDGVFERRGEPITAGLARLVATVAHRATAPDLEATVQAVLGNVVEELHDDPCLLLIERPPAQPGER